MISCDAAVADKFAGSLISFYRRDTSAKAPALYTNGAALSWEPRTREDRPRPPHRRGLGIIRYTALNHGWSVQPHVIISSFLEPTLNTLLCGP